MICYACCPACGARTRTTSRLRDRAPRAQCVPCGAELVWMLGDPSVEDVLGRQDELERALRVHAGVIVVLAVGLVALALLGLVMR